MSNPNNNLKPFKTHLEKVTQKVVDDSDEPLSYSDEDMDEFTGTIQLPNNPIIQPNNNQKHIDSISVADRQNELSSKPQIENFSNNSLTEIQRLEVEDKELERFITSDINEKLNNILQDNDKEILSNLSITKDIVKSQYNINKPGAYCKKTFVFILSDTYNGTMKIDTKAYEDARKAAKKGTQLSTKLNNKSNELTHHNTAYSTGHGLCLSNQL